MESVGFKEWAVVCEAMGRGRQSIILRKGGIAEGREGFSFKYPEFFLFPTWFHAHRIGKLLLSGASEKLFLMVFAVERFDDANSGETFLHRHGHLAHTFLLVLNRLLGALSKNPDRQQTGRKKDERDQRELPIHQK